MIRRAGLVGLLVLVVLGTLAPRPAAAFVPPPPPAIPWIIQAGTVIVIGGLEYFVHEDGRLERLWDTEPTIPSPDPEEPDQILDHEWWTQYYVDTEGIPDGWAPGGVYDSPRTETRYEGWEALDAYLTDTGHWIRGMEIASGNPLGEGQCYNCSPTYKTVLFAAQVPEEGARAIAHGIWTGSHQSGELVITPTEYQVILEDGTVRFSAGHGRVPGTMAVSRIIWQSSAAARFRLVVNAAGHDLGNMIMGSPNATTGATWLLYSGPMHGSPRKPALGYVWPQAWDSPDPDWLTVYGLGLGIEVEEEVIPGWGWVTDLEESLGEAWDYIYDRATEAWEFEAPPPPAAPTITEIDDPGHDDENPHESIGGRIMAGAEGIVDAIWGVASWFFNQLQELLSWLLEELRKLFERLEELLTLLTELLGRLLEEIIEVIKHGLTAVVNQLRSVLAALGRVIDAIQSGFMALGGLIGALTTALTGLLHGILEAVAGLPALLYNIATNLIQIPQAIVDALGLMLNGLFVPSTSIDLSLAVPDWTGTPVEAITTQIPEIGNSITGAVGSTSGSCGPGFSQEFGGGHGWEISFYAPSPSGSGCPDSAAEAGLPIGDLAGYREPLRALAAFALLVIWWTRLARVLPWGSRAAAMEPGRV